MKRAGEGEKEGSEGREGVRECPHS